MPAEYVAWQRSWLEHNPGWKHRVWGEADLDGLPMVNRALYDAAGRETAHLPPVDTIRWRVDVARLEILHRHGGIYVDADAECLRPLDLLLNHAMFVAQSPNDMGATNNVMGASPGHPFLDTLIRGLPANAAARRGQRLVEMVGGKYLTRELATHKPPDVVVLPWWLFAAQSIRDRRRGRPAVSDPRAYVRHVYGNTLGRRR
jgi:mannosyltransferase OCH1-like enzyme